MTINTHRSQVGRREAARRRQKARDGAHATLQGPLGARRAALRARRPGAPLRGHAGRRALPQGGGVRRGDVVPVGAAAVEDPLEDPARRRVADRGHCDPDRRARPSRAHRGRLAPARAQGHIDSAPRPRQKSAPRSQAACRGQTKRRGVRRARARVPEPPGVRAGARRGAVEARGAAPRGAIQWRLVHAELLRRKARKVVAEKRELREQAFREDAAATALQSRQRAIEATRAVEKRRAAARAWPRRRGCSPGGAVPRRRGA